MSNPSPQPSRVMNALQATDDMQRFVRLASDAPRPRPGAEKCLPTNFSQQQR